MADRGRDLKFSILSDLSQLNTEDGARGLDDLGDAAKAAGKNLDRLNDDVKDSDLEKFGDEAKATARKVDDAFDTIARASRQSSSKVDADLDKGKKSLDEFSREANSTGKESAASFSGGFDDVAGAVQEVAANAFAGFGPMGAAAGAAAAIGIGLITSGLQKSADKANEAKDRVIDLAQEMVIAGGALDGATIEERIKDWSFAIADNKSWWELWQKSNTTNLEKFAADAEKAGVSGRDFIRGMSGEDPEAAARSIGELEEKMADLDDQIGRVATTQTDFSDGNVSVTDGLRSQKIALQETRDALQEKSGVTTEAIELMRTLGLVVDETSEKEQQAAEARQAVVDTIAEVSDASSALSEVIQTEAQKQADATKTTSDTWSDYADNVELSAADIVKVLDEQTKAAENFRDNLLEVQQRGDEEFLAWVSQQPANVAAAYAEGTAKEQTNIYNAYSRNVGAAAGAGIGDGLAGKEGDVAAAASRLHAAAAAAASPVIPIPMTPVLRWDPNGIRQQILGDLGGITVRVGVSSREAIEASRNRP